MRIIDAIYKSSATGRELIKIITLRYKLLYDDEKGMKTGVSSYSFAG
jgi:hypothetical protein